MIVTERDAVERTYTPESSESVPESVRTVRFVLEELGIKDIREDGVDEFVCESPFSSDGQIIVNSFTRRWRDAGLPGSWSLQQLVTRLTECSPSEAEAFLDGAIARSELPSDADSESKRGGQPRRGFKRVAFSAYESQPVGWFWRGYLPRGKVTVVAGNPGLGKSTLITDIVARLSVGEPMPLQGEPSVSTPIKSLLILTEDGVSDTVRPRLEAAGADLDQVFTIECDTPGHQPDEQPTIPGDLDEIERLVVEGGVGLLAIDTSDSLLGEEINANSNPSIRRLMTRLMALAARTDTAIILVTHFNKDSTKPGMYRTLGSIGLVGAARSVLYVIEHPEDESLRILSPHKVNLTRKLPGVVFSIEGISDDSMKIAWHGTSDIDIDTASQMAQAAHKAPTKRQQAGDWLREGLSGGPRKWEDVVEEGVAQGLSESTLLVARGDIGAVKDRIGAGKGSYVLWSLPETADKDESDVASVDAVPSQHKDTPPTVAHADPDAIAEPDTSLQQPEPLDERAVPSVPSNGHKSAQALPTLDEINLTLERLADEDREDTVIEFIVTDSVAVPDEPPHLAPDDDYWDVVRMHEPEFENPDDLFGEPESEPLYECDRCPAPLEYDALLCPFCQYELDTEHKDWSEAAD